MSKAVVIINNDFARLRAAAWVGKAPIGTVITFSRPRRSNEASAKMWAMLTDIADQLPWHGMKLTATDYKELISAGLRKEVRTVPNIDNTGFVLLGMRTSEMTVGEMNDMIALIDAFGTTHGVTFTNQVEG